MIKWGTIIPLLGGMTIGNYQCTGIKPTVFFSYEAFAKNDAHCFNYFNDTPVKLIDSDTNKLINNEIFELDFVSSVCPCAGLSNLTSRKTSRDDAPQNEWLYKSAEFILGTIKPKVFFGENAPALFNPTLKVSERLREIGLKYGYSFSLYKTDTMYHGIPQKRPRTFYFFWKSKLAPFHNSYRNERKNLKDFLVEIKNGKYYNQYVNTNELINDELYILAKTLKYTSDKQISKDISEHHGTILVYLVKNGLIDIALKYCLCDSVKRRLEHVKSKISIGKNFRDCSPIFYNGADCIGAVQGNTLSFATHPIEERYLNIQELMCLMGLPPDFELVSNNWNHILTKCTSQYSG